MEIPMGMLQSFENRKSIQVFIFDQLDQVYHRMLVFYQSKISLVVFLLIKDLNVVLYIAQF